MISVKLGIGSSTNVEFYYNLEIDELFKIAEDVKAVTNSGK